MTTKNPAKKATLQPPALLDWAAGHPAHLETAAWLSSVYGAAYLRKPSAQELSTLLLDLECDAPAAARRCVHFLLRSLPPSFMAREEIDGYLEMARGWSDEAEEGKGKDPRRALLGWCQERRRRHVSPALWLLSVHGVSSLAKPRFQALETLLIDVKTHGPELLFNLAAVMLKAVPPAFATAEERREYRNAVEWLSLTPSAEETAP